MSLHVCIKRENYHSKKFNQCRSLALVKVEVRGPDGRPTWKETILNASNIQFRHMRARYWNRIVCLHATNCMAKTYIAVIHTCLFITCQYSNPTCHQSSQGIVLNSPSDSSSYPTMNCMLETPLSISAIAADHHTQGTLSNHWYNIWQGVSYQSREATKDGLLPNRLRIGPILPGLLIAIFQLTDW